jgi:Tol biopolymer transport system component
MATSAVQIIAHDVEADPTWSPDGSTVVYASEQQIWSYAVATGDKRSLGSGGRPAFAPDGTALAVVEGPGSTVVVMAVDGTRPVTVADGLNGVTRPSWSPDSRSLTFAAGQASAGLGVYVVNRDGTGLRRVANSSSSSAGVPAWSPDGTLIAFRTSPQDLAVVQPDGGGLRPLPEVGGPRPFLEPVVWTPDSHSVLGLVTEPNSPTAATVYRVPVRVPPGTPFQVWPDVQISPTGDVGNWAWSLLATAPDGTSVLYGGSCGSATPNNLCIVDTPTGSVRVLDDIQPQSQPVFGP